jgi:hypothetical protein
MHITFYGACAHDPNPATPSSDLLKLKMAEINNGAGALKSGKNLITDIPHVADYHSCSIIYVDIEPTCIKLGSSNP